MGMIFSVLPHYVVHRFWELEKGSRGRKSRAKAARKDLARLQVAF